MEASEVAELCMSFQNYITITGKQTKLSIKSGIKKSSGKRVLRRDHSWVHRIFMPKKAIMHEQINATFNCKNGNIICHSMKQ
jgi:hypothetical protein